jgi:hypothetical protein
MAEWSGIGGNYTSAAAVDEHFAVFAALNAADIASRQLQPVMRRQ